jgi:hypothetical protein
VAPGAAQQREPHRHITCRRHGPLEIPAARRVAPET